MHGPITAINAIKSKEIYQVSTNPFVRLSDDYINNYAKESDFFEGSGPKGRGFLIDTSRCFHMGSRTRVGNRIMLILSYHRSPGIFEPSIKSNTMFNELGINVEEMPDLYSKMLLSPLRPNYLSLE